MAWSEGIEAAKAAAVAASVLLAGVGILAEVRRWL